MALIRNAAIPKTIGRVVLGSYLAVHGAQKLFGSFGGDGLDATGEMFESIGLTPGRQMAQLGGATEFGGGLLTATGIADPLGPLALAGAMSVATAVHRDNGPLAADGGFEQPLTNLAFATVLAAAGSGAIRLGPRLPRWLAAAATIGAAGAAGAIIGRMLANQQAAGEAGDDAATGAPDLGVVEDAATADA